MSPIELLEDAFTGHLCNGQAGRVSAEDVAAVHLHYSLPSLCLFCSFFFLSLRFPGLVSHLLLQVSDHHHHQETLGKVRDCQSVADLCYTEEPRKRECLKWSLL